MPSQLEKETVYGLCEEPNYRAPLRATGPGTLATHAALDVGGERFTASGAGSRTTIVSATALTVATNEGYCLTLVRCVAATNVANVGITCVVTSFNSATDTATLAGEGFPAATSSGDQFEMADIDVRVVETTAGGTTTGVVAATRAGNTLEPDGFWTGYYLVADDADNNPRGTPCLVTNFTTAFGTISATVGTTVRGDTWWLESFPKLWGPPDIKWNDHDIDRPVQRGDCGEEIDPRGERDWEATLTLPLKGSGTAAGDGVAGVFPMESKPILRSYFATKQSTGDAVVAASGTAPALSTTSFNVATGGLTNFPVGSVVHDNAGRTAMVVATAANGGDPDSITVWPPLGRIPIAAEVMRGAASYEPQVTGHKTLRVHAFGKEIERLGFGGAFQSLKIEGLGRNEVPKIVVGLKGGYWIDIRRGKATPLLAQQDTSIPKSAADALLIIAPESADGTVTRLIVESGSIDFGPELFQEPGFTLFDAMYGGRIVNNKVRLTLKCSFDKTSPNDTYAIKEMYYASRIIRLWYQHYQVLGKTCSFGAYRASWMAPEETTENGINMITFTVKVLTSELTNMAKCLLAFS